MGRSLVVIALALVGLLSAAGMGYAAYVVSRDSVAVPVTKLQQTPQQLTPNRVREHAQPKQPRQPARPRPSPTTTRTATTTPTTTGDDHGGRSPGGSGSGSGGGSGSSGHGSGHGSDD